LLGNFDQGIGVFILGDLQLLESIIITFLLNLNLLESFHVRIMLCFEFFFGGLLLCNNFFILLLSKLLLGLLLEQSVLSNLLGLDFLLDLELSSLLDEELGLSLSLELRLDGSFLLLDRLLLSFKELLG
jgi:hypothetical protein